MGSRVEFDPGRRKFIKLAGATAAGFFLRGCRLTSLTPEVFIPLECPYCEGDLRTYLERRKKTSKKELCLQLPLEGGVTQGFWGGHRAIDIGSDEGAPVLAAADGIVSIATIDPEGSGRYVIIDHGRGFETVYGHLQEFAIEEKERVLSGEKIGEVGMTGRTTGPHLHFEVRKNGEKVNPIIYLDVSCEK